MNIFKKTTLVVAISLSIISTGLAQNSSYEAGQKALHNENYFQAAEKFEQASLDEKYRQASWYWLAYSLYKIKQNNKAKGILKELLRLYPTGNWAETAEVLLFEHSKDEERSQEFKLNDELRLIAIEQLVFNNPEKGIPLVTDLLMKTKDLEIKRNALHLLGVSDSSKASSFLYNYILHEQNKALKNSAVQMLSLRNSKESFEMLTELYRKSQDNKLKSTIIQGYIHSDDPDQLVRLLKGEKNVELNRKMIQLLGVMGANKQLAQLRNTLKEVNLQKTLIQSLAISGDSRTIKQMAENSKNKAIQIQAIGSLVMLDDISGEYMIGLYKKITDQAVKRKLISTFVSLDVEPKLVLKLLIDETNKQNKKDLLNVIQIADGNKELFEFYQIATDVKLKREVIHMLGINDQYEKLNILYKQTSEIENKKEILHAFAINNSKQNTRFLLNAYGTDNIEIKKMVIHSFLVQDNPDALLVLLENETGYDLKKEIIQTLSYMDSDVIIEKLLQEQ